MEERKKYLKIILNIVMPVLEITLICVLTPWFIRFFMPFVIGWLIAMIANPLVRFLEKKLKMIRKHSSVIIVVVVLGAVIGILYLLISKLIFEVSGLIQDLPHIYETIQIEMQGAFIKIEHLFGKLPLNFQESLYRLSENLGEYIGMLVQKAAFPTVTVAGNMAKRIPVVLVSSIVTILSSYFFIVEREHIISVGKKMIPEGIAKYFVFIKKEGKRMIGGYFLAQFRIMFVVAVILTVGFLVLQVNYGVLLAMLISILDFLPLFGTGTALIPWAIIKLLAGEYPFALGLILLYVLTQVVRQIIQPKIVGDTLGLPPFLTLFFLYIGFKVRGLSGMILAVPIGMIFLNLCKYGAFDGLVENSRLLMKEIQEFRK